MYFAALRQLQCKTDVPVELVCIITAVQDDSVMASLWKDQVQALSALLVQDEDGLQDADPAAIQYLSFAIASLHKIAGLCCNCENPRTEIALKTSMWRKSAEVFQRSETFVRNAKHMLQLGWVCGTMLHLMISPSTLGAGQFSQGSAAWMWLWTAFQNWLESPSR